MQPNVSPDELRALVAAGKPVAIVDVRDAEELDEGFIPGSIHIPNFQIEHYAPMVLPDKAAPIILLCATAHRAVGAAEVLRRLGYTDVRVLAGGFEAWNRETKNS
ncbi:MAG: rhodanese-like domain-containing protein [Patescibacteria group bacterium]